MDTKTSTWLTKQFIQKALQHGREFEVTVDGIKIDMPVPKGNNFVSDIYGVEVTYRRSDDYDNIHKKSLIVKNPIKGSMYETMLNSGYIQKESIVYYSYIPKFKSVIGENNDNLDDDDDQYKCIDNLLPKSYYSTIENVVILEDLKTKCYKMVDKVKRLDYEHCVLALKTLAKFHAGSVVVIKKYPKFVEEIGKEVLFCKAFEELYSASIKSSFEIIARNLRDKKFSELRKYSNWFEENKIKIWDILLDEVQLRENEFGVLNHGDFWLTNMMFRYRSNDENTPEKCIPIDFQVCRYTSPAVDFLYFVESSAAEDVRNERFNDLIINYLNELNLNLEIFGISKRLEEFEFKKSIAVRTNFRIAIGMFVLSVIIADPNEKKVLDLMTTSLDDLKNVENNPFEDYLSDEKYLKILTKRMEKLEQYGLININN